MLAAVGIDPPVEEDLRDLDQLPVEGQLRLPVGIRGGDATSGGICRRTLERIIPRHATTGRIAIASRSRSEGRDDSVKAVRS